MKKEKKEKDEGKGFASYLVKAKSLEDLARNASTFGEEMRPLYAVKEGKAYRLFSPGVKVGDTRIVLYAESKDCKPVLVYRPETINNKKLLEFRDIAAEGQGTEVQNIPVIEFMKNPFEQRGKAKAACIEAKDCDAIVKGVMARTMDSGIMPKVYAFKHKSQMYVGSFSVLEEEDVKLFSYAKFDAERDYPFFRYNYATAKVEPTDMIGEHSYIYVRIVNLSEPFAFFKTD